MTHGPPTLLLYLDSSSHDFTHQYILSSSINTWIMSSISDPNYARIDPEVAQAIQQATRYPYFEYTDWLHEGVSPYFLSSEHPFTCPSTH